MMALITLTVWCPLRYWRDTYRWQSLAAITAALRVFAHVCLRFARALDC